MAVNARDAKQVAGRKTDVSDAQWLQRLPEYGFQHMQKALIQMNVQLHHVVSDITCTRLAGIRSPSCRTSTGAETSSPASIPRPHAGIHAFIRIRAHQAGDSGPEPVPSRLSRHAGTTFLSADRSRSARSLPPGPPAEHSSVPERRGFSTNRIVLTQINDAARRPLPIPPAERVPRTSPAIRGTGGHPSRLMPGKQEGEQNMAAQGFEAIQQNPKYQELVRTRSSFGWTLSAVTLIIYFGFILLIAYAPKFLGIPIGDSVMTIGLPIGLFVIVSAFVLVGIYVRRANSTYDRLIRDIIEETRS
jgi:uncharacterized membrane protein (DUF485 family)